MEKPIFREKAIQRVTSPENLNDYVRVSTPATWFILVAILLLLIGIISWAVFGRIDSKLVVAAEAENGTLTCYVSEEKIGEIRRNNKVEVNGTICSVAEIQKDPISIGEDFPEYALHVGGLKQGEWVYLVTTQTDLPDGIYKAEIVTETIKPMSFISSGEVGEE